MLRLLRSSLTPRVIPPIEIGGMKVTIKLHAKARRLTLRYDAKKEHFVLSSPKRASKKSMVEFVTESENWMRKQVVVTPQATVLKPGSFLPLEGKERLIIHTEAPGVEIVLTDDTITVKCREARFPRALDRFIRQRAHNIITSLSHKKAMELGRSIQSIQLRDTTTRWGSCTHDGKLSFSWRLIMAPAEIIDYVVAHEVAHLAVFDHSPKFWATCRTLTPHTTFGKHWLQQNGSTLHQIKIINETPLQNGV